MMEAGTRVRATLRRGHGSETVVGVIDRQYLERYDSKAVLTIWIENSNYLGVIIDARHWNVEKIE